MIEILLVAVVSAKMPSAPPPPPPPVAENSEGLPGKRIEFEDAEEDENENSEGNVSHVLTIVPRMEVPPVVVREETVADKKKSPLRNQVQKLPNTKSGKNDFNRRGKRNH